jgi:hypothetical protein
VEPYANNFSFSVYQLQSTSFNTEMNSPSNDRKMASDSYNNRQSGEHDHDTPMPDCDEEAEHFDSHAKQNLGNGLSKPENFGYYGEYRPGLSRSSTVSNNLPNEYLIDVYTSAKANSLGQSSKRDIGKKEGNQIDLDNHVTEQMGRSANPLDLPDSGPGTDQGDEVCFH